MLHGKVTIAVLTVGLIKRHIINEWNFSRTEIVRRKFVYYSTKSDLRNATSVDTTKFAKKVNLASLKSNVDKLDVDKLVPVSVDLSKLKDVVKNMPLKKCI